MSKALFSLFACAAAASLSCANQAVFCDASPLSWSAFTTHIWGGSFTLTRENGAESPFVVGQECSDSFVLRREASLTGDAPSIRFLECKSNGRSATLDLSDLADARFLTLGEQVRAGIDLALTLSVEVNGCRAELKGGTVKIAVREANGGAAPYPQMVTSDYVRRYSLHIEVEDALSGCGKVSTVADLELEQTASDVVAHESTVCR